MSIEDREDAASAAGVLRIMNSRRRVILLGLCAGAVMGVGLDLVMTPVYRARVRIEIRRTPDELASNSVNFQSEQVSMYTAAEKITGRALLGQVADECRGRGWIPSPDSSSVSSGLAKAWTAVVGTATRMLHGTPFPTGAPSIVVPDRAADIDWLQTIVTVQPLRDTRLVDVLVEHPDSTAARVIAGRIGELFVSGEGSPPDPPTDSSLTTGANASVERPSVAMTGDPIDERAAVEARQRLLENSLSDLTHARRQAAEDLDEAESRLARLRHATTDTDSTDVAGSLEDSGTLGDLSRDLRDARQRLADARAVYGPSHPRMIELKQRCATLRGEISAELARRVGDQRGVVGSCSARLANLNDQLSRTESALRGTLAYDTVVPQAGGPLIPLQGIPIHRNPSIEIADAPTVEPQPVRPRRVLNVAVGSMAGGLLSSALALWRSGDPRRVRSLEDVESLLGLPVFGVIPRRGRRRLWGEG